MVVIRLTRGGSKKKPFYNIVVANSRSPRDGRFIEKIGFYNPGARGAEISLHLDSEKYAHWVSVGGQPSDRVASLYKLHIKNNSQDLAARHAKITKPDVESAKSIA